MKVIVVYYSLEGNTKYTAEKIASRLNADKLELVSDKEYPTGKASKFIWGGKSVVFGEKPKLKPYNFDLLAYDAVIIGTPIWAGTFAPPIKTFISENQIKGKKIGLFACSSSGNADKCFAKLKAEMGAEKGAFTLSLKDPIREKQESDIEEIEKFCKNFLTE